MNSNWSYSPETPNLGQIQRFLEPCDLEIWQMTFKNNRAPLLQALYIISKPLVNSNWRCSSETPNLGQNQWFLEPCDLEIWQTTLKNSRAPRLTYFKLCASFHKHRWIRTGAAVRKRPIWVKINDFLSCVTLKYDRWPWKTIGHLFYATWSFVHHFVATGELKLELWSGNGWIGFWPLWPWSVTPDLHLLHGHHFCHW